MSPSEAGRTLVGLEELGPKLQHGFNMASALSGFNLNKKRVKKRVKVALRSTRGLVR